MKRLLQSIRMMALVLCTTPVILQAQNLVVNPSFETVNAGSLQCSWYTTQAQFNTVFGAGNWTCPTGGSSDIMSSTLGSACFCATNSTNASSYGTEVPRTGNVMVGGSWYGTGGCSPYREYVQGTLSTPLVVGTTYKIEFYVSLGDKSQVGINNIGLKFSTGLVNSASMCVYNVTPDVNYTGTPITTKTGWAKIEFCYTPTAPNLQYFMIGNFFSNVATTTTNVGGTQANAYYFIDDVSIAPSTTLTPTATIATICSSPTMTLTGMPAAVNYTWTAPSGGTILSGVNAQSATAQGAGVYTLTVRDPMGCVNIPATATVLATPAASAATPTITGTGTLTCLSSTLSLSAIPVAGATYTWSGPGIVSGGITSSIVVNAGGNYVVTMTSGGCISSATTTIPQNTTQPTINLTPANTNISCASPTVQLSAILNPASATYTWVSPAGGSLSNASVTNPVATGNGVFTVTATNPANGCVNSATASLVSGASTVTLSAASASICSGGSTALTVTGNATSYSWTPSATLNTSTGTSVIANPGATTVYTVTGTSASCTGNTTVTVTVVPLPNPVVTPASQLICQGQSASLNVSGGSTYTWSPAGSLSSANAATVSASPAVTTVYSVLASVSGCTASAQATVNVVSNPSITLTGNTIICAGDNTVLTAQGVNTYTWSPAASLSTTSGSVVTANPASTITYSVSGSVGTCTSSAVVTVTVNAVPVLTVSPSQTVCAGTSANLSVSGATSYTWSPAASLNTASGPNVIATPAATTNYTVTGSAANCTNTAVTSIQVNAVPVLTVTPAASSICFGGSTTLGVSGATAYTWSPSGSLNTASSANVIANPTLTTVYSVTGSAGTCTASAQATVNVISNPVITITGNPVICFGSGTALTANGLTTYTWSPATGLNTTSGSLVTASPVSTTNYTINGHVGTCTAVAYVTVTVNPLPVLTASPSQTLCAGSLAQLLVSGASSYTWNPATYLSSTLGASVTSTPAANIVYTVTGANAGCTNTISTSLVVNAIPSIAVSPSSPSICAGGLSNMNASGAGSYTWSPATALSSTTGANVTSSSPVTITYTVQGELASCLSQTVVTLTVVQPPALTISPNATICSGTSTNLAVSGANFYTWSPMNGLSTANGGINVVASPASSSSYTVTGANTAGCTGTIGISVAVVPTPVLAASASPAAICEGSSSALSATGATSYTWSLASTLSNISGGGASATPALTTIYTVTGSNGSLPHICLATQTVEIVVTPTVNLVIPTVNPICFGEIAQLQASGATSYTWSPATGLSSPNQAMSNAKPSTTTVYTVTGGNGSMCTAQGTVALVVNPLPQVYAGADTTVNIDEFVTLNGTGNVPVEFLATGSTPMNCNFCSSISVNPQEKTCYTLRGTSSAGCVAYDEVCVFVTKDWNIYIPNAFTPNGDADNDVFIPVGYGLTQIKLFIFDRWGTQIFAGDETNPGWDGKLRGKLCEQGVYIYQVEIKTMAGNTIKKVGHVTLLGTGTR